MDIEIDWLLALWTKKAGERQFGQVVEELRCPSSYAR